MKLTDYILLLIVFWNFQYTFGQKDTLFVENLDTVKLNIDQPLVPVITCEVNDSITEILVYFQLTTNSKNLVIFKRVHSGGGAVIFGHYQGKRFIDGNLQCQLKHVLPELNSSVNTQKKGIQFVFYESVNGEMREYSQWFTWIGGRKNDDD